MSDSFPTTNSKKKAAKSRSGKNERSSLVVLHDYLYSNPGEEEIFNVDLAKSLAGILRKKFKNVECKAFCRETLDDLKRRQKKGEDLIVFNLVENVRRKGELQYKAAEALEKIGVPFTGCPSKAARDGDTDKILLKKRLDSNGLPTAWWRSFDDLTEKSRLPGPCIVKSAIYHGSWGISEEGVSKDPSTLLRVIKTNKDIYGGAWYIEEYIEGREFFLGMIGSYGEKPEFLPLAEVLFDEKLYGTDRPKILSYDAKWMENGIGYAYGGKQVKASLLKEMQKLSAECWKVFGLNGYARVDFRVDGTGQPYILEVNTNPYLGLGESLIFRAAEAGGIGVEEVLSRIVACPYRHEEPVRALKSGSQTAMVKAEQSQRV